MKLPFKLKKSQKDKRTVLWEESYTELLKQLDDVRTMFDYATDSTMVDALIYEENALLCRLEKLYKDAREQGISLKIYENRKS